MAFPLETESEKKTAPTPKPNRKWIMAYSGGQVVVSCYGEYREVSENCIEITSEKGELYTVYNGTVVVKEQLK